MYVEVALLQIAAHNREMARITGNAEAMAEADADIDRALRMIDWHLRIAVAGLVLIPLALVGALIAVAML